MVRKRINIETANSKKIKRIDAIAKVSAQLFSTKGYLATTVDDIAAAAKITKGGVYHYFGSKADILHYISLSYVKIDRVDLGKSLNDIKDVSERVKFTVFNHIAHYVRHPTAAKTLMHESYNLPPKFLKEVRSLERQYFETVSEIVSDFLGEKATKELVTTLTFTLFGMMNWIYRWYDPKGGMKPLELSELIYEIFTQGVGHSILK